MKPAEVDDLWFVEFLGFVDGIQHRLENPRF